MDSSLFSARVSDTYDLCYRTQAPHFLGFLSPIEAATAEEQLKKLSGRYAFFGGYDGAERTILVCLPDWCEGVDFPISSVSFNYRECDSLCHRDFLGVLMGLGITREKVGDILVEKGRAVVFLSSDIFDYVLSQITKVGNVGVTLLEGFKLPLPQLGKKVKDSVTAASLRVDCVVAALCGISRNSSSLLIEEGKVSINSIGCTKTTKLVCQGDKLSVRGKGRFEIDSVSGVSKKGKTIIEFYRFV